MVKGTLRVQYAWTVGFYNGGGGFFPKLKDSKPVGGGCSGVEGGWLPDLRCIEEERAVRAGKH